VQRHQRKGMHCEQPFVWNGMMTCSEESSRSLSANPSFTQVEECARHALHAKVVFCNLWNVKP